MSQSQPRLPRTIPTSIAMSHQSTSVARNRQVTSSWLPQARTVHVRCPPAKHNNRLKSPSSYSNVVPPQSQFKKKKNSEVTRDDTNTCFNNSTPTCICYSESRMTGYSTTVRRRAGTGRRRLPASPCNIQTNK